jgi:hypothetical protein
MSTSVLLAYCSSFHLFSVAGLLTARVCHDHFERVLIVEAEAWVASEEGRKMDGWNQKLVRSRVAQYASLHGVH